MRDGPSKIIEAVVGLLVPPASREHVLGDLRERYAGTRSYLSDALSAVPGAIAGRLLRTTGWQLVALRAGALYLSFLVAAWAAFGAAWLRQHGEYLRLLLPAGLATLVLVVGELYAEARSAALLATAFAVGCGVVVAAECNGVLPAPILCSGGVLAAILISTLRVWFPPGGNRPRGEVL